MRKSLADIKQMLKNIADNHANINQFFFGSYTEVVNGGEVLYSLMVATVQPSTLTYKKTNISISITFADKYKEGDYEMRDDVQSDLLEIASDVRALMRKEIYDDFEISDTMPLRPFVNYSSDLTCGWIMDITFEVDDYMNFCQVPN